MKTIAIYPGRFHPFHRGHYATYEYLVRSYGKENVFVASTNTQAPLTSPFSFEEKKQMMVALGIPANRIVQVKNPYKADEITQQFDKNDTAVVFALSEKDTARFSYTKKDGSPSYMQPFSDKIQLQPYSQHAYVEIAPTVNFSVGGQSVMSASAIRSLYIGATDELREKIIADLYGAYLPKIKQLFDRKLALVEAANTLLLAYKQQLFESKSAPITRLVGILDAEKRATAEFNLQNYII